MKTILKLFWTDPRFAAMILRSIIILIGGEMLAGNLPGERFGALLMAFGSSIPSSVFDGQISMKQFSMKRNAVKPDDGEDKPAVDESDDEKEDKPK